MKKTRLLSSIFAISTMTVIAPIVCSCSNQSNLQETKTCSVNNSNYCKVVFEKGTADKLEGTSIIQVKSGRKFGSIEKPIATKKDHKFEYWTYSSNGAKIEDSDTINDLTMIVPYFSSTKVTDLSTITINAEKIEAVDPLVQLKALNPTIEENFWNEVDILSLDYTGILLAAKPTSTTYKGYKKISCIVYNGYVTIDSTPYYFFDINNFCQIHYSYRAYWTIKLPEISIDSQEFNYQISFNEETSFTEIPDGFLDSCFNFNKPITFPKNITKIGKQCLCYCSAFNQSITIPENVTEVGSWFLGMLNETSKFGITPAFNSDITINSKSVKLGISFLHECTSFNGNFINCSGVETVDTNFLAYCSSFNNTSINKITNNGKITSIGPWFLTDCTSFNQSITLSSTLDTEDCIDYGFCENCNSLCKTIYINSTTAQGKIFVASTRHFSTFLSSTASLYTTGVTISGNYTGFDAKQSITWGKKYSWNDTSISGRVWYRHISKS